MGYYTTFTGKFKLSRNFTPDERRAFHDFVNSRRCRPDDNNKPPEGQPSLWCDWRVISDPIGTPDYLMALDGKNYSHGEWLTYLWQHFFKPWGIKLTGKVEWVGEDWEFDMGYYKIEDDDPTTLKVYEAEVTVKYHLDNEEVWQ